MWMLRYSYNGLLWGTSSGEGTYGDWAVCLPTYAYSFGDMCIMANKNTKLKKTIGEIIEWAL